MNNQNKHYQQLTLEQRYHISAMVEIGLSCQVIGQKLGKHRSSIYREICRNSVNGQYHPCRAEMLSAQRRKNADKHSKRSDFTDNIICSLLAVRWSPQSISERMKVECEEKDQLSHTTIYRRVEEDRASGGRLYTQLIRFGKTRWKGGKRQHTAGVRLIPDRVDITKRPLIVENRSRIGDWEGDLVHGQDAELVTLLERKSRFFMVKRVFDKTKVNVGNMLISMLNSVSQKFTLTLDNGGEFADHVRVTEHTGVDVYFAKPYASWQRGSNENANGRLRRIWPKKFNIAALSEKEIQDHVMLMNFTPRKILKGLTPFEVFTGSRVALIV